VQLPQLAPPILTVVLDASAGSDSKLPATIPF
jgi:hypothetical protein